MIFSSGQVLSHRQTDIYLGIEGMVTAKRSRGPLEGIVTGVETLHEELGQTAAGAFNVALQSTVQQCSAARNGG